MARLRFVAVALLALAFAGSATKMGRTQVETPAGFQTAEPSWAADDPCTIYSLTDMGYDTDLGKWIAETIPEMIEPSSWKEHGGTGVARYYAPKNILIVNQSKTIQKKVGSFLKDLKTSMLKGSVMSFASKKTPPAGVVPADYREPSLHRTSTPASEPASYPVPAAVKPPKHLFHFIIRYEGDGIIDDNVVKFMKSQLQGAKSPISVSSGAGAYVPYAPPAANGTPVPPSNAELYSSVSDPTPAVEPSSSPKKKKETKDSQKQSEVERR